MARKGAVLSEESHVAAVSLIEDGLCSQKTVREILEDMRKSEPFKQFGKARLLKEWSQTWRPMVAKNGRAPLPKRGGRGAGGSKSERRPRQHPVRPIASSGPGRNDQTVMEEMLDLVTAMVNEFPDTPAKDAVLRAYPRFVQAVRGSRLQAK